MSVNSKMTAIAGAIRNLLDINEIMGLDAMANNISSITKRGAVAGTISTKSEQYIIPAGYHNGNGTVGIADAEQAKIIAENIKNGVTILGVSGTASGDIYAIIAVTYPAGSTCTCSDGTTTLTARDTSGKALFNVPSAGTWTVSCTDGSSTVSKSVTITATGQVESVSLYFLLWLYNKGDECISVTGGWQSRAWKEDSNPQYSAVAPTLTKNADSMHIIFPASNKSGVVEVVKDIDLSGYNTLKIILKSINNYTSNNVSPRLIIVPRSVTYWYDAVVGFVSFNKGQSGEYSIDLTALSLSERAYDIAIGGETYKSKYDLEVESVWAE